MLWQIMETGVLSEYEETWERCSSSSAQQAVFRLKGDQRTGALLISGDYFMFAADRTQPLAASGTPGLGSNA